MSVMTNIQTTRHKMKQQLGNLYGLRIGREYGFSQCKQELGWTNYRFTNFEQINRWWEIIFSAYWMVSSHSKIFRDLNPSQALSDFNLRSQDSIADYTFHPQWSNKEGWKSAPPALRSPQRIGRSKHHFKQLSFNYSTCYFILGCYSLVRHFS